MPTLNDIVPIMKQNLYLNQKWEKLTYQIIQNVGLILKSENNAIVAACTIKFAAWLNGIDLSLNNIAKMNQVGEKSMSNLWKNCIKSQLKISEGLDKSMFCTQPLLYIIGIIIQLNRI